MLYLLEAGQYQTFALLLFTIVISLSCHEFGHAWSAKYYGDRTAEQQGRLTLNPRSHIDPIGLIMIVFAGFGWARPVPTTPRHFNSPWATCAIAAAGPLTNLVLAILVINLHGFLVIEGIEFASSPAGTELFRLFVLINIMLMLFNLIPIGPLDGHYILPYLLSTNVARVYTELNDRFGTYAFMGLILLSFSGVPIFSQLWSVARWIRDHIQLIG